MVTRKTIVEKKAEKTAKDVVEELKEELAEEEQAGLEVKTESIESIKTEEPDLNEKSAIFEAEISEKSPAQRKKKYNLLKLILVVIVSLTLTALVIVALMLFVFKDRSIACEQINDQPNLGYKTETKTEIIYSGKFVKKIKIKRKVEAVDNAKLSNTISSYVRQYDINNVSYSGYKYTTQNIDDTHAEINSEIDYEKLNMEKYLKDNPAMKEYTEEGKMTLDGAKKMYEKSGYSCK